MARKRKTRASEAQQEPEPVQSTENEPVPEPEPEQPQHEEIEQTLEEDPEIEDEVLNDEQEEQDEDEGQDGEGEEEEEEEKEQTENMEELKNDSVLVEMGNNEEPSEITEKPLENENGGEAVEEEEEDGEEEEPLEKLLEPFSKDQLTLLIKEAISRHPDLVENVHKLADADPAHRKIFVHGLGWEASSETITSVFSKYGEIEDCKVVKDKVSGKSKGYGFIVFKHRGGARKALKKPQKMIEGRMASCQLASAGPVHTPPTPVVAAVPSTPVSEYTQRKIYVSNVSAELDPKKLLEFFSKFGEIEDGPLGLDKQTGKPRGFCLFVYKSVESAKKALEEPHKNFEGQMLHCQKAVDGPKHTKGGFFNQQHGQPHHHQGHHGNYHHTAKKGRYGGSGGGAGHSGGHLMAPSGPGGSGFNQVVAPAALGQAVAALLATQGPGFGNFLGGMNPQGVPPMMNNAGYGGQSSGGGYGGQPGMQGGYGGQPQMGQGGVRPHHGGAPYMGRGR